MGSNASDVQRTADAVVRALKAWPETRVGNASDPVPNRRGAGCRIYIEVLADVADQVEVTVERDDQEQAVQRRALSAGRGRRLRPQPPHRRSIFRNSCRSGGRMPGAKDAPLAQSLDALQPARSKQRGLLDVLGGACAAGAGTGLGGGGSRGLRAVAEWPARGAHTG
jgi:hypothetical protein